MRLSCILLKENKFKEIVAFIVLILVTAITDISHYVSWVIADIPTSWIFLGVSIFFLSLKWHDRVIALSVVDLAIFFHNSNVLISILIMFFICVTGFIYRLKKPAIWDASKKFVVSILIALLFLCIVDYFVWKDFSLFPPRKGTFLIYRLTNYGLLSKTLEDYCPTKKWSVCKNKKVLASLKGRSVPWISNRNAPPAKLSLFNNEKEVEEIVFYTAKSNVLQIFKYSLKETFKLLSSANSLDGALPLPQYHYSLVFESIKRFFPNEVNYFENSYQGQRLPVRVKVFNINDKTLQRCIYLSLAVMAAVFIFYKEYGLFLFIISVLAFIFLNAFVTASIVWPSDRYNMRVAWLVPYMLLLTAFVFISKRYGGQDRKCIPKK